MRKRLYVAAVAAPALPKAMDFLKADPDRWGKVIRQANVKPE